MIVKIKLEQGRIVRQDDDAIYLLVRPGEYLHLLTLTASHADTPEAHDRVPTYCSKPMGVRVGTGGGLDKMKW